MKGYEAVAEMVRRTDFDTVYSMLGGTVVPWIAEGVDRGTLRLIKTRHEDAAVSGATGHARSTARAALCAVTRGPGFTNTITALVAAIKSHVPVLLVTGESPNTDMPNQNVDQRGLAGIIGAGFHFVADPVELEATFLRAVRAAYGESMPQILSIRSTVFDADLELSDDEAPDLRPQHAADETVIAAIVEALADAQRPVILAGWGAVLSGCRDDLVELAGTVGAGLATTLRALHLFEGHPANLGLSGGWASPDMRAQLARADLVVAFGASLNDFTTDEGTVFPLARVIRCDLTTDREPAAVEVDLDVVGDAAATLKRILAAWHEQGLATSPPADVEAVDHGRIREDVLGFAVPHDPVRGLDPRFVYAELDRLLPEDRIVVTDSGRFLGTLPSLVRSTGPTSWLVGNSYSCIGLGLGAAIGASAANPDRPVVLFAGDGGFMMSSHDLDAVRLNGLRLTIVVMNDEYYGSDAKYLTRYGLKHDIIIQTMPDVEALAAAFGGTGRVIRDLRDLAEFDFSAPGIRLLDVRIDRKANPREVLASWVEDARKEARRTAAA